MNKILTTILSLTVVSAFAQDLPKPSPAAKMEQRIGLTDITIEYSRPGVKDRTIWGDLVPYDEIWRAGANKATQFTTSETIIVNGSELAEGTYSLFILPKKGENWVIIFNKITELWGTGDYADKNDALRVQTAPESITCNSERLEYHFIDVNMDNGILAIDWAGKRLPLKIEADPRRLVRVNIDKAIASAEEGELWKVYRNSASYAHEVHMTKEGLEWIKKSVELKDNWYSYWVYAQLQAQNGDKKEAITKANKAIEIGQAEAKESGNDFSYEARIKADIETWKK